MMSSGSRSCNGGFSGGLSCVAVYCGAREPSKEVFNKAAEGLGACLAKKQVSVVYGGSRFGLMGKMADSLLQNGGKITGIIPEFFTKMEGYSAPGEEIIVPDMHTRKKRIFDKAQAFIALPGGIGTMEELTEVITWSALDLHTKYIAVLNVDGYYDHFLAWIQRAIDEGFISTPSGKYDDMILVSSDPQEVVDRLCAKFTK